MPSNTPQAVSVADSYATLNGIALGEILSTTVSGDKSSLNIKLQPSVAQKTTIKILSPLVLMILPGMLLIIVGPAVVQTVRTLTFRQLELTASKTGATSLPRPDRMSVSAVRAI